MIENPSRVITGADLLRPSETVWPMITVESFLSDYSEASCPAVVWLAGKLLVENKFLHLLQKRSMLPLYRGD